MENLLQFVSACRQLSMFVNSHHHLTTSDNDWQCLSAVGNDSRLQVLPFN